jgi:transposase-like protein
MPRYAILVKRLGREPSDMFECSSPFLGTKHKYSMRISEITYVAEGTELKSTLASLNTILGSPLNDLYITLGKNAEINVAKDMTLKQHNFVSAGVRSRWLDQFGQGLKGELHSLVKQIPARSSAELKKFLLSTPNKLKEFEDNLPKILIKIGKANDYENLASLGRNWEVRSNRYRQLLASLDWNKESLHAYDPDAEKKKDAIRAAAEKKASVSKQNIAADQMVAHVLNVVPQNIRHEIRTKIQKTPIENRIQVLAQLLQSKGIKL